MYECLHQLTGSLPNIQTCILDEHRRDVIIRNNILNSVIDMPYCRLVYEKLSPTLSGVTADLQSSVALASDISQLQSPIVSYADRRRHNFNYCPRNCSENRFGESKRVDKKCIVCGSPGCWSKNHLLRERMSALRKNEHRRSLVTSFHIQMIIQTLRNRTP